MNIGIPLKYNAVSNCATHQSYQYSQAYIQQFLVNKMSIQAVGHGIPF